MPAPTFGRRLLDLAPAPVGRLWDRVRNSPVGYRLASGAFWSLAGVLIARGLGLASSILVARMLGRATFGELGIIQSTVGMFQTFAGLGLGMTATKYVAEYVGPDPARAGRIIGLSSLVAVVTGLIMVVVLLVFAPWLAAHTLAAPHLAPYLRIGSVMLLLGVINGAQAGALAGLEAFKAMARINLIAGLALFPLMVGGVYWAGLSGAVGAQVALAGLTWLLYHLTLRGEARRAGVPLGYSGCRSEMKVLWSFSIPAALTGIMFGPVNWVCSTILVNQPGGYVQMGVFNAANQWRTAILFLPRAVETIALPVMSSLRRGADRARYLKVLAFNSALNTGVALLAGAAVAAFSGIIMGMYGKGFGEGAGVLVWLSFSAALMAATGILGQAIGARGQMWAGFALNFSWALMLVGFTWLWADQGAYGLGLANFFAYLLHLGMVILYVRFRIIPIAAAEEAAGAGA